MVRFNNVVKTIISLGIIITDNNVLSKQNLKTLIGCFMVELPTLK